MPTTKKFDSSLPGFGIRVTDRKPRPNNIQDHASSEAAPSSQPNQKLSNELLESQIEHQCQEAAMKVLVDQQSGKASPQPRRRQRRPRFIFHLQAGPDRGCYYHELFIRNQALMNTMIKPTRLKGATDRPTLRARLQYYAFLCLTEHSYDMREATTSNASIDSSFVMDSTVDVSDPFCPLPWPEIAIADCANSTGVSVVVRQPSHDELLEFLMEAGLFKEDTKCALTSVQ